MNLDGTIAGIPKKVALPLGAAGLAGGYIFVKRYKAAKTASTTSPTASATGGTGAGVTTPYGPTEGTGDFSISLPPSTGFGEGQYAALGATANGVVAQNQAIMTAMATSVDQEVTTNKALAALLATNPGALAQYRALPPNSTYEKAMQANMSTAVANIFPGAGGIVPGGVGSA